MREGKFDIKRVREKSHSISVCVCAVSWNTLRVGVKGVEVIEALVGNGSASSDI